jgi:hypothetical protein
MLNFIRAGSIQNDLFPLTWSRALGSRLFFHLSPFLAQRFRYDKWNRFSDWPGARGASSTEELRDEQDAGFGQDGNHFNVASAALKRAMVIDVESKQHQVLGLETLS